MEKYTSLQKLTLKEFVELFEYKIVSNRKRMWLHLIKTNQLICPASKKSVAYCSYDIKENVNTYHYNFYSEDGELFTIDHKIPISLGGKKNNLDNIQPMVFEENMKKRNNLIFT